MMALEITSACVTFTTFCSYQLILPSLWSLNTLCSFFLSTTKETSSREENPCYERPFLLTFLVPLFFVIFLISLPFALLGLLIWLPSQKLRPAYIYSCDMTEATPQEITKDFMTYQSFTIATCNLCLLPEALSRVNNLSNTIGRAKSIGNLLCPKNTVSNDLSSVCIYDVETNISIPVQDVPQKANESCNGTREINTNGEIRPLLTLNGTTMGIVIERGTPDKVNGDKATTSNGTTGNESPSTEVLPLGAVGLGVPPGHSLSLGSPAELNKCSSSHSSHSADAMPLPSPPGRYSSTPHATKPDIIVLQEFSIDDEESCTEPAGRSATANSPVSRQSLHMDDSPVFHSEDMSIGSGLEQRSTSSCANLNTNQNHSTGASSSIHVDYRTQRNSSSSRKSRDSSSFQSIHEDVFDHYLSESFPPELDFLCLQEVYDLSAAKALVSKLHRHFPYILYNIGSSSWKHNCFIGNSGLVFASRFAIEEVDFQCYDDCLHEERIIAKGMLMLKIRLKSRNEGLSKGIVGYISLTHLQSGHDGGQIRKNQLNQIQTWLADFRKKTQTDGDTLGADTIAFDILCGDLNFDNESPGDEECWSHSLMTHYQDPCRICQGKDKPWTVGTELIHANLYSQDAETPGALLESLVDAQKRCRFVESTRPLAEPGSSQIVENGKRRTDYILYNLETSNANLSVEEYHFVTQLASHTDHLAVAMRFHLQNRR